MSQPRKLQITIIATITMLSLACPLSYTAARGGISHTDIATAKRIDELPPEIRDAVLQWQSTCGSPLAARPLFAHYLEDKTSGYRLISLHFHELRCDNEAALCTKQGCLHQVYVSTDGTYSLALAANVPELTLTFIDHKPAVEIGCALPLDPRCPRVLHWDGRGFAEQ